LFFGEPLLGEGKHTPDAAGDFQPGGVIQLSLAASMSCLFLLDIPHFCWLMSNMCCLYSCLGVAYIPLLVA
jgi:hypothetical protein